MAGYCRYRAEYDQMVKIREASISFVSYYEAGGTIGAYPNKLIDDAIDALMLLKADRDQNYEFCGKEVPMYDQEGNRIQGTGTRH